MKKYLSLVVVAFALVFAGALSAYALTTLDTKGLHSDVVAGVLSRSGNTVKLYYNGLLGSDAFCVGENVPIFKQYGLAATERLEGEVHITRHIGKNIAEGRLIDGNASRGDVATKPTMMCLKG
jgi:ethanolamine utilization protein EutA (predicted chaperonin)